MGSRTKMMDANSFNSRTEYKPGIHRTNGECMMLWCQQPNEFLAKQKHSVYVFSFGPVLFCCFTLPTEWFFCLDEIGVPIKTSRNDLNKPLSEEDLEAIRLVEEVVVKILDVTEDKMILTNLLDAVDRAEKILMKCAAFDTVKDVLAEAEKISVVQYIWNLILQQQFCKEREKQTKVLSLFVMKQYQHHVIGLAREGKDVYEEAKKLTINEDSTAGGCKEKADEAFEQEQYEAAVKFYSRIIANSPLDYSHYRRRGEAYFRLKQYREAACDWLRVNKLKPDWPKGYCEHAKMLSHQGLWQRALMICQSGLEKCTQAGVQHEEIEELKQFWEVNNNKLVSAPTANDVLDCNSSSEKINDNDMSFVSVNITDNSNTDKIQKEANQMVHEEKYISEMKEYLRMGSKAYLKGEMEKAVDKYEKALQIMTENCSLSDVQKQDQLILKYALAMASVHTNSFKLITNAVDIFRNDFLHSNHSSHFPAAYFGLSEAYIKLSRYEEAKKIIDTGLTCLHQQPSRLHCWPMLDVTVEETDTDKLEEKLKTLLHIVESRPPPDGICKAPEEENHNRQIYTNAINFQGFLRISCLDGCCVDYHLPCWEKMKPGKMNFSALQDTACPTPDCISQVAKILVCGKDGSVDEFLSDRKPVKEKELILKQPPSNDVKIKKGNKYKKKDTATAAENTDDKLNSKPSTAESTEFRPLDFKNYSVEIVKKNEAKMTLCKGKKQKKKKKKPKPVLALQVDFNDKKEGKLYGEHSIDKNGSLIPCTVAKLQPDCVKVLQQDNSQCKLLQEEEILLQLFCGVLAEKGPLPICSPELQEIASQSMTYKKIIAKAGGLLKFLKLSPTITMSSNIMYLRDFNFATAINQSLSKSNSSISEHFDQTSIDPDSELFSRSSESSSSGSLTFNLSSGMPAQPSLDNSKTHDRVCTAGDFDDCSKISNATAPDKQLVNLIQQMDSIDDIETIERPITKLTRINPLTTAYSGKHLKNGRSLSPQQSVSELELFHVDENNSEKNGSGSMCSGSLDINQKNRPCDEQDLVTTKESNWTMKLPWKKTKKLKTIGKKFGDTEYQQTLDVMQYDSNNTIDDFRTDSGVFALTPCNSPDVLSLPEEAKLEPYLAQKIYDGSRMEPVGVADYCRLKTIGVNTTGEDDCKQLELRVSEAQKEILALKDEINKIKMAAMMDKVMNEKNLSLLKDAQHEFKVLEEQMKALQDKNDMMKQENKELNRCLNSMSEKIESVETSRSEALKQIESLFNKLEENRGEAFAEKQQLMETDQCLRLNLYKAENRAQNAEVALLKIQQQEAITNLKTTKNDAVLQLNKLAKYIKQNKCKLEEQPEPLTQLVDKFSHLVHTCDKYLGTIEAKYLQHINEIKNNRKTLDDLPPIELPNLPPTPLQQLPNEEISAVQTDLGKLQNAQLLGNDLNKWLSSTVAPSKRSAGHSSNINSNSSKHESWFFQQVEATDVLMDSGISNRSSAASCNNYQNNFEKIIDILQSTFPQYSRDTFMKLVQQLRQEHGNSLKSLSMEDILNKLMEKLVELEENLEASRDKHLGPSWGSSVVQNHEAPLRKPNLPPPGFYRQRVASKQNVSLLDDDYVPCLICQEEISIRQTVILDCGHRFHDDCIRKWIREQSTCPACRVHALLPDEFPLLV